MVGRVEVHSVSQTRCKRETQEDAVLYIVDDP